MTLNLNGVTVELPNDVQVDVSEDGKHVKITTKPAEVVERIRVIETPGPVQERIRVVEKIVEQPCSRPHTWPYVHPLPTYPSYPTITGTAPNWVGGHFTSTNGTIR